jgi:hypothetical protein
MSDHSETLEKAEVAKSELLDNGADEVELARMGYKQELK